MEKTPIVSIIVPVYNVEKYLDKCLECLVKQSLTQIQIICVNDGSYDSSLSILERYAECDDRIIIIDKENEGVSIARNVGVEKATGRYVLFVDADDWIEEKTCEVAVGTIEKYDADVVMWPYVREFFERSLKKQFYSEGLKVFEEKKDVENLHRRFVGVVGKELRQPENADALCTVWGKLYKRDIICDNNITFVDLKDIGTYEDGLFNLNVFGYVKKAVYIDEYLYHYRKFNEDSVTSRYNPKLTSQWRTLFDMMHNYIQENKLPEEYAVALDNRIALSILGLGLNILSFNNSNTKKIVMIKDILDSKMYRKAYEKLELGSFPLHWRVFYQFAKRRFAFGVFIMLLLIRTIISSK